MKLRRVFESAGPLSRSSSADALAGVELAAMSMPQSLGYASIARMPAVTGLYTLLLPLVGFAAFGSSRYLVVAADSATAAILAAGITGLQRPGGPDYATMASMVALLTGGLLILARILKLGFVADFMSQTVLTGFLTGVGLQVAIGVLGQMMGLAIESRRTPLQLVEIASRLPQLHLPSVAISVFVVAGVLILGQWRPRVPGPLIAVLAAIAASALWNFAGRGIAVIGPVAAGLPNLRFPQLGWRDLESLIPIAVSCFVVIVTQSAATARTYALSHHQALDEDADLAGLAAANGLAALSGTFVVNGSPTQTAIVESAGSKSQVAQLSAAIVIALILGFFTRPLAYLPRCVLGSIVFIVAIRLMRLRELGDIRRESPGEFMLAAITAAVVVVLGVEQGIVLAMVMSLLRIVQHSYHPDSGILVEAPGDVFRVKPVVAGAQSAPGLTIYRFGAPLFYANARRFSDEVRILASVTPPRWIIIDASPITKVDFTAARIIENLLAELALRNVVLVFAHVEPELRSDLDRHRLTERIGRDHIFDRVHDAMAAWRRLDV